MFRKTLPERQSARFRLLRVLVAGGTGFLGRAIVSALADGGIDVSVLTRDPARAVRAYPSLPARFAAGDLADPNVLTDAMLQADAAVFTVQFTGYPVEAPAVGRTFMDVDARGTQSLARAARRAGVPKIVYLSGVGADVFSNRIWCRAKGLAEEAVREAGPRWTIVRPSWVYGPDDVSLNRFVGLIQKIPFFFPQLGSGSQQITPLYIDDLAALVRNVVVDDAGDGTVLEAGGPQTVTLDEIIATVMRVLGQEKPIVHIPLRLAKLAAKSLELFPGQILSADAIDFLTQDGIADTEEISRCFPNFRPRKLAIALEDYLGNCD